MGEAMSNGRAAAIVFAREGARVAAIDREPEQAQRTADLISAEGGTAVALTADVTREDEVVAVVARAREQLGTPSVLHNNVGITVTGDITDLDLAEWDRSFTINLGGVFLACKHTIPIMVEAGHGAIVNVSSVAGIRWTGYPYPAYMAAKSAVNQLTVALAGRLLHEGHAVAGEFEAAIGADLLGCPLDHGEGIGAELGAERNAAGARLTERCDGEAGDGEHIDRLGDGAADCPDLVEGGQAGRIEHIRPGFVESLQPSDGVVEIGPPAEEILGAGGEHEIGLQGARRADGGRDPLEGMGELVNRPGLIAAIVFDRTAGQSCGIRGKDGFAGTFWAVPLAFFEVGGHRQLDGAGKLAAVLDHGFEAHRTVFQSARESKPGAGRGQRREAQVLQKLGCPDVPRIGNDEGAGTGMQRAQGLALVHDFLPIDERMAGV